MSKHNYYRHLNRIVRHAPVTRDLPGIDQTVKTVNFCDLRRAIQSRYAHEDLPYDKIESRDQWKPVSPRTVLSIAMEHHKGPDLSRKYVSTCQISTEGILYKQPENKCQNSIDQLWKRRKVPTPPMMRNSIIGYEGGDEFKVLEDNGAEIRFQLGNHCGISFNPSQHHQMVILAKDNSPYLSGSFIEGAQEIHVSSFDSIPNPTGHLLAGNRYLSANGYKQNKGAMGAMLSRLSSILYTDFGRDYSCLVTRNGQIIYATGLNQQRHRGCVRVRRGDVVFIGSMKCFNVVRPEEIGLWSGFLCGRHSIAQFCQAAVAETTVRIGEVIRDRLQYGNDDYEPNMVCAIGIIS